MKSGEVTISVFADYSKSFDFDILLYFAIDILIFYINLIFLQFFKWRLKIKVDISTFLCTSFGVPQGSILRLVLFKLCVSDMFHVASRRHYWQYADNTTIYTHCKIKNLKMTEQNLEAELNNLLMKSNERNLVFNSAKTKSMVIAFKQKPHVHNLDNQVIKICYKDKYLEQVSQFKLLETTIENYSD